MTLKKGNYLEFRLLSPVTDSDSTFRMAAAPIMKRADGAYYDLNFNNDSTISITNCRATFVKTDGTVETVSVNGITQDGTTSDGRRIYVCTFEIADDASTRLRGLKQDDDGTNAVSNVDTDLIIETVDVGETFKIAWDAAAENGLKESFTAASTTDTVTAGEALDATSTTLGLSLHTDNKYYKYDSVTYPDLQGMLPRGQNIASDASFTITWLNGTVSTESGLTANTLYNVEDGGTLTTTATSTTKKLANSRGTTVLVGIQDLGIQSSTDGEITAGTDTVPKLQSAAQIKLGAETHSGFTSTNIQVRPIGETGGNSIEAYSSNTTANFFKTIIGGSIELNKIVFHVNVLGTAGDIKFALYNSDGSSQLWEETITLSSTGVYEASISTERNISPGQYILGFVTVGTTNVTLISNFFIILDTTEKIGGRKTVTAGTLPSTIDMTTVTAQSEFPYIRFDN